MFFHPYDWILIPLIILLSFRYNKNTNRCECFLCNGRRKLFGTKR